MKLNFNKYTTTHTIYATILVTAAYFLQPYISTLLAHIFMAVGSFMYWYGEGKTEWYTWVGNISHKPGILPQDEYHNWRIVEQGGTGLFIYGLVLTDLSFVWTFALYLAPYPVYLWQVKRKKVI